MLWSRDFCIAEQKMSSTATAWSRHTTRDGSAQLNYMLKDIRTIR